MRKIRVFVDTSVFGGVYDDEFSGPSKRFFERVRRGDYFIIISSEVIEELQDAPEQVFEVFQDLPADAVKIVHLSNEAIVLATEYVNAGVVGEKSKTDALHVAVATIASTEMIVSWNFKHIVNVKKIHGYNAINLLNGYRPIEIHSPLEMSDDD